MKKCILFFLVSAILYAGSAHCKSYDSLIVPVELSDLIDKQIKEEINVIKNGPLKEPASLGTYRSKYYKSAILNTYKNDSWKFYTNFSGENLMSKKGNLNAIILGANNVIAGIDFYHMKYVLSFNERVLEPINRKIRTVKEPLTVVTNAYISGDRARNYLQITVQGGSLKKHWIFVVKNSEFVTCVFFEE